MRKKNKYTQILSLLTISTLIIIGLSASAPAITLEETQFEILDIKGGFGQVILEAQNVGDAVAEDIEFIVRVEGGALGRINIEKVCTGCSDCGTTVDPGVIKKETTAEVQYIFGFGPLDIYVSADAANAPKVEDSATGFILGPFVIITG